MDGELLHAETTDAILRAGFEVHRALGPGLLESAYEICLFDELIRNGHEVRRQVEVPVVFKGRKLDCGYRLDLLVDEKVIIEVKCVDHVMPIHESQLITYLRLTGIEVGLLMNFNSYRLKDGIVRRVLSKVYQDTPRSLCLRGDSNEWLED